MGCETYFKDYWWWGYTNWGWCNFETGDDVAHVHDVSWFFLCSNRKQILVKKITNLKHCGL